MHVQFCGEKWYSDGIRDYVAVNVPQADEVRLWDGSDCLLTLHWSADHHGYIEEGETPQDGIWSSWEDAFAAYGYTGEED